MTAERRLPIGQLKSGADGSGPVPLEISRTPKCFLAKFLSLTIDLTPFTIVQFFHSSSELLVIL